VRDKVSVVSNLVIPRGKYGNADQPGGIPRQWHPTSMGPLLSGNRFDGDDGELSPVPTGQTSDETVARARVRGLHYRVQAEAFKGTPERGIMSWRQTSSGMAPNHPTVSARQAFDALINASRRPIPRRRPS
jgi:hypothetical protein